MSYSPTPLPPALRRWADRAVDSLGPRALPRTSAAARRLADRLAREAEQRRVAALADPDWVEWAYHQVFHRAPDTAGRQHWTAQLRGGLDREGLLEVLRASPEARGGDTPRLALETFHGGRTAWTRSLPRARRILDLGGTSLDSELGSLIVMGYPYDFEELVIIDLPAEDRHTLYQVQENADLVSDQGPVRYLFRSMVDLDDLPDAGFDLIVSGQTFEHITEAEGAVLLGHVRRLLAPGGTLALDTPNRRLTEIECATLGTEFINPDHKVEYTHPQLLALFEASGLDVVRAHGIGYMPQSAASGEWDLQELVEHAGLYDAVEDCYTLAYLVAPAR